MPEIFIDLINIQAGVVPPDTQQKNNLISHSAILKVKFGQFLLIEANNRCAFPCCDKFLIKIKEGLSQESYEISKIEKNKDDNPNNLVALCPDCFLTYQTDNRKYITKQLLNNKKLLASAQLAAQTLSDIKLDEGIESVLTGMSKLKYSTCDITLEPKELTDKISTQTTRTLFLTVKNQVIENYVTVNKIFINLDKQGKIDYEEIQYQMRSMYKTLKKAKKDSTEIFNTISEKIHSATLQDIILCQIIVSFFIQKCEILE